MTGSSEHNLMPPPAHEVENVLRRALVEDLAQGGDLTSAALVPPSATTRGRVVARAAGTIAGLHIGLAVFDLVDGDVSITALASDGDRVEAGTTLATLDGSSRAILTGERTCLNILGHLSGIATSTRSVVDAVSDTRTRIADTRKTTPGLRALEKYAVRCGGGMNHRFGLHDAVMIKDNHLVVAASPADAVRRVRSTVGHTVSITIEVDRLDQIESAVDGGADIILLDNLRGDDLRRAVELVGGRAVTEASGNITLETAAAVAASGVDVISLGWITHSAPRLDVALDL
ncbi:MAG: carboxylating nicotinate-nucleotide diphosphorylase [Acidimicrobiales bacterium]